MRMNMKNRERGNYLIESGLCFVVFFTILLGILDVGRGIYSYNFIASASKEGASYAMVHGNSSGYIASASDIQTQARFWLPGGVGGDSATVNSTWAADHKQGNTHAVEL